MTTQNLLVELFVEELPPKALKRLGEAFSTTLAESLKAQGLAGAEAAVTAYASPRRLAAHVTGVAGQAADKPVSQKLMPVSVGLDGAGNATPALLKKLAGLGLDAAAVAQLKRQGEGKAETLFFDSMVTGATLADGLQKAVEDALAKLPIPKVMTYQLADGWSSVNFVRPAHGLVALHGADVVPVSVLGLASGRATQGHRFEAACHPVVLRDADGYAAQMAEEGAVIAGFEERRDEIARQLAAAAERIGGGVQPIDDPALLDEVTALVERPNVLACQFEEEYLQVPQECLILTMKANQKYFPLLDAAGRLTNRFLIVSNIKPADPSAVIGGNERVVRPRLADAKFFFDQDRKKPLAARVEALDRVVYHNKLGSQGARVRRLMKLAGAIARELGAEEALAVRAAELAKADLLTDMVGEFPELQGIMGRYYALHDGEDPRVADAVEAHYKPKFAGDTLAEGNVALAVALAERLETLTGMFGIGAVPTGDKDPFALRRAALGVLRMLMERYLPLDLMQLLELAQASFDKEEVAASTAVDVFLFMQERLRVYLRERGAMQDEVESVVVQAPTRIDRVPARLAAVAGFRALPEAAALAAANKRIRNILKKADAVGETVDLALLQAGAEADLHQALVAVTPEVEAALANLDYTAALTRLAGLRAAVDRFFDEVMVMADEPLIRANRLALLAGLARVMNSVADISELSV
ncbi:glycine--tRNA ligase subunit beta [Parasulfuritortus cantonensis]|uniref:Glycine--tRNA ligase beta subunit n=1 Tax=Parasulfuritortus cantonensis TaxID=2528202 RepID=A0A4R1BEH4_9PROT|nr:glycine--tRNA ligase subunit beta [Parasulfuritortus cantonensis]TCJ15556.1 glycine--tRNA ligase subunit beta [Parasulfuritortus cantonensis]